MLCLDYSIDVDSINTTTYHGLMFVILIIFPFAERLLISLLRQLSTQWGNLDGDMDNWLLKLLSHDQISASRGPNIKLKLSKCRTIIHLNSFINRIILSWNTLTCSISSIESMKIFR